MVSARFHSQGSAVRSIVGKGNHSVNHVQKLKPRVEQVCQELGLQYTTEENAGRIYIDLTGGPAHMPSQYTQHGAPHHQQQQQQQQHGQQPQYGQQQYQGGPQFQQGGYPGQQQQQHYGPGGQQQNDPNAEIEAAVKRYLPRILRKLEGCCTMM